VRAQLLGMMKPQRLPKDVSLVLEITVMSWIAINTVTLELPYNTVTLLHFHVQVRAQLLDIMKTQRLPLTSCTLLQNWYITILCCQLLHNNVRLSLRITQVCACAAAGHHEDAAAAAKTLQCIAKLLPNTVMLLLFHIQVRAQLLDIMKQHCYVITFCNTQVRGQLLDIMKMQRLLQHSPVRYKNCFLTMLCCYFFTSRCVRSCWTS
jgi:hypothetical protein